MKISAILLMVGVLAVAATPVAATQECEAIIEKYKSLAENANQGDTPKPIMAQIAFNKSRGDSMHYHLGYGPAHSSGGALQIGIKLTIAHFEHNPATDEHLEFGELKEDRKDLVIIALYPDGGSQIVLADWDTDLPLQNMQCYESRVSAYISGTFREDNGFTLVSIVLNRMTKQ